MVSTTQDIMDRYGIDQDFAASIESLGNDLGVDPMYLANTMYAESTLNPSEKNRAGSGAIGLIQFTPKTARNLGTTTDELSRMTPVEQMEYVRKYFSADNLGAGRLLDLQNDPSQHNVNMAVFLPSMIGKPVDTQIAKKYWQKNGSIRTPADYTRFVEKHVNNYIQSNPVDTQPDPVDAQTDEMLSEEQPESTFRPDDGSVPSDTGTVTSDQAEEEPGFLDTVGEYVGDAYDTVSEYAGDAYDTASEYVGETVDTLERVAESVGDKLRRLLGSEEEQQSSTTVDNPPIPERRPVAVDEPPVPEPRPDQTEEAFSAVEDFVGTLKKAEGGSVEKEVEFVKEDDDDVPDPPPGATPEEVADDIPAYLSTGEYVLPANVVRYIGLKNITDMHQRALAELQQMEDLDIIENVDENGYVEEDDDEMDYMEPEEAGVVEIVVAEHHPKGLMAMGFAEGGLVEAMVYVPGVGFVPQSQAATRPSQKKTDEDTRAETREGPSGRGGTDTGKSMSEMSPMEQAAFGEALSGPLGGAIEAVSKGVVGGALGLASPLGVEMGYSLATDVPTAAQQAMKSVDLDIAKAKAMATMSPTDLAAAQEAWSGPVSNEFGATTNQMNAHAEAVAAGNAPAGSVANAAGGYSTKGEFGFSTNKDGDVVANDPDRNGVPGDQTGTSTAAAQHADVDAAVGGGSTEAEAAAAEAEAAAAEAEAAGAKRGGYVTRSGIMAKGFSQGGEAGDPGGGPGGPLEYEPEPEVVEEEKPTDPYEGYTYVKGIGYVPTSRRMTSDKPVDAASLALSSIFTPGFLETIGLMSDPNKEL